MEEKLASEGRRIPYGGNRSEGACGIPGGDNQQLSEDIAWVLGWSDRQLVPELEGLSLGTLWVQGSQAASRRSLKHRTWPAGIHIRRISMSAGGLHK